MPSLEALIFDVDGTLADTERDGHRVAFNRAFAGAGLDWNWSPERYGELLAVSGGKERIRYFIEEFVQEFACPADLDGFIAEIHRDKTRHYLQMLTQGRVPLRPGIRRLLQEAKTRGLVLAIATTTTPANVEYLLANTLGPESISRFAVIAAGDVVPAKKPAPDVYHLALQEMGLPADVCLALEDSDNGLRSSLGAGIRTVITVNGYTSQQDFTGASLVVDHLGEPDRPCRFLAGPVPAGKHFVDVDVLQRLAQPSVQPVSSN